MEPLSSYYRPSPGSHSYNTGIGPGPRPQATLISFPSTNFTQTPSTYVELFFFMRREHAHKSGTPVLASHTPGGQATPGWELREREGERRTGHGDSGSCGKQTPWAGFLPSSGSVPEHGHFFLQCLGSELRGACVNNHLFNLQFSVLWGAPSPCPVLRNGLNQRVARASQCWYTQWEIKESKKLQNCLSHTEHAMQRECQKMY